MKLAVIGTGYVGLTQGACLAEIGHVVYCVDVDARKIKNLKRGILPIYEPGLEELVVANAASKRLHFTTDVRSAIEQAEVVFSAVGTPPDKDYRADLTAVHDVARSFGRYANGYKVFVNKSTVPVGTGRACREIIDAEFAKRGVTFSYDQVSNPEFLREGVAVADCLKPDRIVVGAMTEKAAEIMREVNQPIIDKGAVFFSTSVESAEVIKYASNTFLATKITFMNEIAHLCELVGADVTEVAQGVGLDQRIGKRFLHAGIGFGGSCFPKDIDALGAIGRDHGYEFEILVAVKKVNERQKGVLVEKLLKHLPDLRGLTIAVWGLAFKPKTDDMRDAPSRVVIRDLVDRGARVRAYDPAAMKNAKAVLPAISYARTALDAASRADALLVLTDWDEFRGVDFDTLKKVMKGSIVGDGRNIWRPQEVREHGFTYFSIGRI